MRLPGVHARARRLLVKLFSIGCMRMPGSAIPLSAACWPAASSVVVAMQATHAIEHAQGAATVRCFAQIDPCRCKNAGMEENFFVPLHALPVIATGLIAAAVAAARIGFRTSMLFGKVHFFRCFVHACIAMRGRARHRPAMMATVHRASVAMPPSCLRAKVAQR